MEEKDFNVDERNVDEANSEVIDGESVNEEIGAASGEEDTEGGLTKTESGEVEAENSETKGDGGSEPQGESEIEKPRTYKVKFNHEERELDEAQTVKYAQKGMKYEQVESELKLFREVAKKLGHENVTEFAKAVDDDDRQKRIDEYMESGVPESLAKRLAEEDMEKLSEKIKKELKDDDTGDGFSGEAEKRQEIAEFVRAFPNVKHIPKEVVDYKHKHGVTLATAYAVIEAEKAKQENSKLKKGATGNYAPVRSATKHGSVGGAPIDPFLEGFNEDY